MPRVYNNSVQFVIGERVDFDIVRQISRQRRSLFDSAATSSCAAQIVRNLFVIHVRVKLIVVVVIVQTKAFAKVSWHHRADQLYAIVNCCFVATFTLTLYGTIIHLAQLTICVNVTSSG